MYSIIPKIYELAQILIQTGGIVFAGDATVA